MTFVNYDACDAPEHVMNAGISVSPWKGGNAPTSKELLYSADESSSSWTVAAFMIVAIALAAVGGAAAFALMAEVATGLVIAGQTVATTIGGAAALGGAVGGAIYGVAAFTQGGATSIVDAQAHAFGNIQDGVQAPASVGNRYLNALLGAIEGKQIIARFGAGLAGDQQVLVGNCPMFFTQARCNESGLDPGTLPRPDTLQENDNMKSVYQRYQYCRDSLNLTGSNLQQCAAPSINLNDPTVVRYNTPDFR